MDTLHLSSLPFLLIVFLKMQKKDGREWFHKWEKEYILTKAFKEKDKTKNASKWDLEKEA